MNYCPSLSTALCEKCGLAHSVEALDTIWEGAEGQYCAVCREDVRDRTCTDCGDMVAQASDLIDYADSGDFRCAHCHENHLENQAEAADQAASEAYYGGECSAEVYERASQREFDRSMKRSA